MRVIFNIRAAVAGVGLMGLLADGSGAAVPPGGPTNVTVRATNSHRVAIPPMQDKITKSDAEWKKQLTPEQFRVLRQKDTERPFSGAYWNTQEKGVYRCAGCGAVLFESDSKFDAGCGWPSFSLPAKGAKIAQAVDNTYYIQRTEVLCARCGGHLGHVFDDGPQPTGLRYCINSASLKFEKKPEH